MKINMIMLVIVIVITIIYLVFSIWNTFITKKQIVLSVIDGCYTIFLEIFAGAIIAQINYWLVAITVILVLAIWLKIVSKQWEKNYDVK